jgi:hypothetical protein
LCQEQIAGGQPVALAGLDLALRECMVRDLRPIVEALLNAAAAADQTVLPPGHKRHQGRERTIHTLLGPLTYRRAYFYDPATGTGQCPFDRRLGLIGGSSTAPLAKVLCRAAARTAFAAASEDLRAYAGIEVGARQIHRLVQALGPLAKAWLQGNTDRAAPRAPVPVMYVEADGTGVPMRPAELAGRKGRQADGTAKTREVKVGGIFTQHTWDQETGQPWRDLNSSSYIATFAPVETFSALLAKEAGRRSIGRALRQVFISDGAAWAANLARTQFPQALHIVDFYHASEHAHALASCLQPATAAALAAQWRTLLLEADDGVPQLLAQARAQLPAEPERLAAAQQEIGYFENNGAHMRYASYRRDHLFIGSGVIEAACKTVVGQRFKNSGMLWSEPGASHVLAFRCALESDRFDPLWLGLAPSLAAAA